MCAIIRFCESSDDIVHSVHLQKKTGQNFVELDLALGIAILDNAMFSPTDIRLQSVRLWWGSAP